MPESPSSATVRLLDAADDGSLTRICERAEVDLLEALYDLTGAECFDVLDPHPCFPVARNRAVAGGLPLYQADPGTYANAQIAAMLERMETENFRRMELDLLLCWPASSIQRSSKVA